VLDENIKEFIVNIILKQIERERSGEMIDRSLISNIIAMMLDLHEGTGETGIYSNYIYYKIFIINYITYHIVYYYILYIILIIIIIFVIYFLF